MTEQEWLVCTDSHDMLISFPAKWDSRKLWLFGCACLRRVWHLLKDYRSRCCVEVAERLVDSQASEEELGQAWEQLDTAAYEDSLEDFQGFDSHEAIRNLVCYVDPAASLQVASEAAEAVGAFAAQSIPVSPPETWSPARTQAWQQAKRQERAAQADLLREVFGNPFRPVSLNPAWLSWNDGTIPKLAQAIYEERAFERLPILADALEEAGCDNSQILSHCRGPGPHAPGCWAVDAILGKA